MSEENTMETETENIDSEITKQLEELEDCKRAYRYLFTELSEMSEKIRTMQIIAESLYIGDAIRRKDLFPDIDEAE